MQELSALLSEKSGDAGLTEVILSIASACSSIAKLLEHSQHLGLVGTQNAFGDAQLAVDVRAEAEILAALRANALVHSVASEENPEISVLHAAGEFSVIFDPLDGSSVVDCAWTVGAFFSVYPGNLTSQKFSGRAQRAAVMAVFGPRTVLVVGLGGDRKFLLTTTLVAGNFLVDESEISIARHAKIFSPGNLRAAAELPEYKTLIGNFIDRKMTLRYSGALVADIFQIFVKKHGLFVSPVSASAPAKLRLAFELAPVALLLEICGGAAFALLPDAPDAPDVPVLDVPVTLDARLGFVGGSVDAVLEALAALRVQLL